MSFETDSFVDDETINLLIDEKNYTHIHNLLTNNKINSPSFGLIHAVEFNCKKKVISAKFLFDNLVNKSNISDLYIKNNFDEYIIFCEKKLKEFMVIILVSFIHYLRRISHTWK